MHDAPPTGTRRSWIDWVLENPTPLILIAVASGGVFLWFDQLRWNVLSELWGIGVSALAAIFLFDRLAHRATERSWFQRNEGRLWDRLQSVANSSSVVAEHCRVVGSDDLKVMYDIQFRKRGVAALMPIRHAAVQFGSQDIATARARLGNPLEIQEKVQQDISWLDEEFTQNERLLSELPALLDQWDRLQEEAGSLSRLDFADSFDSFRASISRVGMCALDLFAATIEELERGGILRDFSHELELAEQFKQARRNEDQSAATSERD